MNSTLKNLLVLVGVVAVGIVGYKLYQRSENNQIETEITKENASKEAVQNNIEKYVTTRITDPNKRELSTLENVVTVHNSTTYTIDSVKIHIEYMRNNGTLLNKQDFDMGIVHPNADLTWRVPNPLQTTPFVKIIAVKSTDLGFSEWKLMNVEKTDSLSLQ